MNRHKVTIDLDWRGIGTVKIDGQEVPNVTRISFDARALRESEVHITLWGMDVEVNAETGHIQFTREG